MAALVQAYAQPSGGVTGMIQPRPAPSSSGPQYMTSQQQRAAMANSIPYPPSMHGPQYGGYNNNTTIPLSPQAAAMGQWHQQQIPPRPGPVVMSGTIGGQPPNGYERFRAQSPTHAAYPIVSRDDSFLPRRYPAPQGLVSSVSQPSVPLAASAAMAPPSSSSSSKTPRRYRRQESVGAGIDLASAPYGSIGGVGELMVRPRADSFHISPSGPSAADDMALPPRSLEDERRFRRRSMHTLDPTDYPHLSLNTQNLAANPHHPSQTLSPPQNFSAQTPATLRLVTASGGSRILHDRTVSSESAKSGQSGHSRSSSKNHNMAANPAGSSQPHPQHSAVVDQESARSHSTAPRPAFQEIGRRVTSPSPLSQPTKMDAPPAAAASPANIIKPSSPIAAADGSESPAAMRLAALNLKEPSKLPKIKSSRLRRAFSFGSAAEFRKATGQDFDHDDGADPVGSLKPKSLGETDALSPEQARIAQKQEEGGIGSTIYGKKFFSGSTDNLSVSSTASSASIMIRKMGRNVKRKSRSLVGLFRPKSVVGAPETPLPEASRAAVSMVTVEAEREADSHVATGESPSSERNLGDGDDLPLSESDLGGGAILADSSRKSLLGGDHERAEALAAVRKGILKYSGSASSPTRRAEDPLDSVTSLDLPVMPNSADSSASSAPSTPNDEVQNHKRTESVTIGNEDYFVAAMRLRQDTKSAPVSSPNTPHGSMKRSATFSPRIIFHDTWHSQEYDRRGDVATCNRLTPLLAQQIKEELNNFKMEMEVHESSKVYTHFF